MKTAEVKTPTILKKILRKVSEFLQQTIEFDSLNLVLFVLWLLTVIITVL